MKLVLELVFLISLPIAVFLGGGALMDSLSGRNTASGESPKRLGTSIGGYTMQDVETYWGTLSKLGETPDTERRFLQLDLVFPFFYGAAFAIALLLVWTRLGQPFHPVWIMAPVIATVVFDWIENLIQLRLLSHFIANSRIDALQVGWLHMASVATSIKVLAFSSMVLLLLGLMLMVVCRESRS